MVLPLFACGGSNTSSLNPNDDGDLVRDENGNIVYNNVSGGDRSTTFKLRL